MLIPDLPQPWLAKAMRRKFPDLCAWTEEFRLEVFTAKVSVENAFGTPRSSKGLPWKAPENRGLVGVGGMFLSSMADSIPVVGQLRRNTRMQQHGGKTPDEGSSSSWQMATVAGSVLAGVGIAAGYMFHQGLLSSAPKEERVSGLADFGDAGAALGLYASQMDAQVYQQRIMEANSHGDPVVEVKVDVDGVKSV
jgi:sorting and assembly machinery component 37